MPPDSNDAGPVAKMLRYARSDFAVANGHREPEAHLGIYAFHAQQAAEKAIKAVSLHLGLQYRFIHSIEALLADLPMEPPDDVVQAAQLTMYAVESRYPEALPDVTETELAQAIELARSVVEWAEQHIGN